MFPEVTLSTRFHALTAATDILARLIAVSKNVFVNIAHNKTQVQLLSIFIIVNTPYI